MFARRADASLRSRDLAVAAQFTFASDDDEDFFLRMQMDGVWLQSGS